MFRLLLAVALAELAFAAPAYAYGPQGKGIGIGIIVPEPSGFTLEAYLSHNTALDFVIGWDTFGEQHGYGHIDYLVLPVDLARGGSVSVPLYLGLGVWLVDFNDDLYFGARVPLGLAVNLRTAPLQFFGEVALRILVTGPHDPDHRLDVDGAVGFRIFF